MRKVVLLALCLVMCMTVITASAEVDLKAMSVEELIELRNQIREELLLRWKPEVETLYSGRYNAGASLPQGKYTLRFTGADSVGSIVIYESENYYQNALIGYHPIESSILYEKHDISNGMTIVISVENSNMLVVDGEFEVIAYEALAE